MARKRIVLPVVQRDTRQRLLSAAPLVSSYAGVKEVAVEMRFSDAEGKQQPSPRGVSFAPDMHAFFQFGCPMRDCVGGGFDATEDLQHALAKRKSGYTGTLTCEGNRPRGGFKTMRCNLQLHYTLTIRAKAAA